jgi:hypothetical protein
METLLNVWEHGTVAEAVLVSRKYARRKLLFKDPLASEHHGMDIIGACAGRCPRIDVQARLCALLKLVPADTPLRNVLYVSIVRTVAASRWCAVYEQLHRMASRRVCDAIESCCHESPTHVTLCSAMDVIDSTFDLELMSMGALRLLAQRVLLRHPDRRTILAMHVLFGQTMLYSRSAMSTFITNTIAHAPHLLEVHDLCALRQQGLYPRYAHVSMDARAASTWLRQLVNGDAVSEEEAAAGMSSKDALLSRFYTVSRLRKVTSKRAILLAVLDGCNLIQFSIRKQGVYNPLGRLLLHCIAYMITEEHADMVGYEEYGRFHAATATLMDVTQGNLIALMKRLSTCVSSTTVKNTSSRMGAIRALVRRGLPASHISVHVANHHKLKTTNLPAWRILLRRCLVEFPLSRDGGGVFLT